MSDVRDRIASRVRDSPGIHFNRLVRALDLAPGQVQHHLRRLGDDGVVVDETWGGRRHYYPPEYDARDRQRLAVLRRETARDVFVELVDDGPARPAAVADAVGIARSTLEWHLDRLAAVDLVEKRRDDRNRVTVVVTRPEDGLWLLGEIEPSLSDRLVDRFTRLVDSLLDEE